jgi:leader peptidase (prepilin peptidase)/N-methyltransferase
VDSIAAEFAASPTLFIGVGLVLGLLVGSFLNVVIYRIPVMLEREWRADHEDPPVEVKSGVSVPVPTKAGKEPPFNLVVPRSACPSCRTPIKAVHNIPVVSWLALKGKCAACGVPIPSRYPLVEALTGVLFAAVAWKLGFGWPAFAGMLLTAFLIALVFIDFDTQYLPDRLTLPLLWIGLLLAWWGPAPQGGPIPPDLRDSVMGAAAGYMSLWVISKGYERLMKLDVDSMGHGDFKLLAALGAWFGWKMLLPIVLAAALVGSIAGIFIIWQRRLGKDVHISFGPFLAAAGWVVLMCGHEVVDLYLSLYSHRR